MSFDRIEQVLFGLFIAFFLATIARALRTGRYGYGSATIARASQARRFWYSLATAALLPAALVVTFFDSRLGSAGAQALLALSLAYYPVHWLRTGAAGWPDALFERREEPREYWLLVAVAIGMVLALLALAAAGAVQAWAMLGSP